MPTIHPDNKDMSEDREQTPVKCPQELS